MVLTPITNLISILGILIEILSWAYVKLGTFIANIGNFPSNSMAVKQLMRSI